MTTNRAPIPTWPPKNEKSKHRCAGACGRTLPAQKFPTVHRADGSIRRGGECRACRDARTGRRA